MCVVAITKSTMPMPIISVYVRVLQPESYPRKAFTNLKMVQTHDYIVGDAVWTSIDYWGESDIGRYYYQGEPRGENGKADLSPWLGAYCVDIDLIGFRKPVLHYRNLLWNDTEKLNLSLKYPNPSEGQIRETMWKGWFTRESWTWLGYGGQSIDVEIYSKYPNVRLYLNNRLVGERENTFVRS